MGSVGSRPLADSFSATAAQDCRLHTCSASNSTLEPAASATISKRSGCSATMSSVCVPMLPVLPSSEKRCGQGAPPVKY
jgi:hypothetical protein